MGEDKYTHRSDLLPNLKLQKMQYDHKHASGQDMNRKWKTVNST